MQFLLNLFKPSAEKQVRHYQPYVQLINAFEPQMAALSDAELRAKTDEFRERIPDNVNLMQDLLPEVFAVVREAAKRVLNMRHFDVQLIGGMVLHEGKIAEMRTGEGKTLVATLPVYLNALYGKGVHVVTVNDYLAQRDSAWMGKVYQFLGLSVGCIVAQQAPWQKRQAYLADITYGTNNEFGFDYLRDNMATQLAHCVQRELFYAIVDEVDSILIDEARTPLIISGMVGDTTEAYRQCARAVERLTLETDFTLDEKTKNAIMTEDGIRHAEQLLGIDNMYDMAHMNYAHMVVACLKARYLYKCDVDYVVRDGEVVIVDEFTGRMMEGRRYSDGLHQAIEAVEGLRVREESQTLATISFQNYFRLYQKLGGMTGTAKTEEDEFIKIYGLSVVEIPTHQPMIRDDQADLIYKNKKSKYQAIINEIADMYRKDKRPVLVGTIAIETSELLSNLLKKQGVPHEVLNAKQHAREAEIIAQAGQLGAVTIATNMAGRGTDIVLGEGVAALGGLHIMGTERHESRRIDNQLRGRAGRQGDMGSSRFYLSLEDDLMRLFGGERVAKAMDMLNMPEDMPIEHAMITKSVERAQKKVEQYHFGIRKQLLQYDDVMNTQRETIYKLRRKILEGHNLAKRVEEMMSHVVVQTCDAFFPDKGWELNEIIVNDLSERLLAVFPFLDVADILTQSHSAAEAKAALGQAVQAAYSAREAEIIPEVMRDIERMVLLREIDTKWIDHLHNMDVLRDGIGLRAYGQKDPLIEYKIESYDMFTELMASIEAAVSEMLFKIEVVQAPTEPDAAQKIQASLTQASALLDQARHIRYSNPAENLLPGAYTQNLTQAASDVGSATAVAAAENHSLAPSAPLVNADPYAHVGRNDPCPCGSGKKFKKCHGAA